MAAFGWCALVLCRSNQIDAEDLPAEVRNSLFRPTAVSGTRSLEAIERDYILSVLAVQGDNRARTAEKLEISLATLYRELREYGMMDC